MLGQHELNYRLSISTTWAHTTCMARGGAQTWASIARPRELSWIFSVAVCRSHDGQGRPYIMFGKYGSIMCGHNAHEPPHTYCHHRTPTADQLFLLQHAVRG